MLFLGRLGAVGSLHVPAPPSRNTEKMAPAVLKAVEETSDPSQKKGLGFRV